MLISGPLASSFSQDQTGGVNSFSKPQPASKASPNPPTSQDDTVTLHHTEPPLLRPPASTIGGSHQTEPPVHRPPSNVGGISAPPVQRLPVSTIRRHEVTAPPVLKSPTSANGTK